MSMPGDLRELFRRWRKPQSFGQRGEDAACRYLKRRRYKIIARGERGGIGELDIVAVDGRTVVFVEVKSRRSHDAGHPAEAIDDDKQLRLTRAALSFLKRHDLLECSSRFDVVAVTWPDDHKTPRIEHYNNAFAAVGKQQMFS
jgi:putative endonuclease